MTDIKTLVKGNVKFLFARKGELWYETETGFKFPVPISDMGDGQFNAEDRAMLYMRYIRKYLAEMEKDTQNVEGRARV